MCRSTLSDDQITALIDRIKDDMPKVCPCCGSAEITPTFIEHDQWECSNPSCFAVWRTGA